MLKRVILQTSRVHAKLFLLEWWFVLRPKFGQMQNILLPYQNCDYIWNIFVATQRNSPSLCKLVRNTNYVHIDISMTIAYICESGTIKYEDTFRLTTITTDQQMFTFGQFQRWIFKKRLCLKMDQSDESDKQSDQDLETQSKRHECLVCFRVFANSYRLRRHRWRYTFCLFTIFCVYRLPEMKPFYLLPCAALSIQRIIKSSIANSVTWLFVCTMSW